MLTILFYAFICIVIFQLLYFIIVYSPLAFADNTKTKDNIDIPVSILVYIKNNETELPEFLQHIADQTYKRFELILINNASEDTSLQLIEEFSQRYSNVRIVDVANNEAFWGNKKYALTLGIKVAKCDHLLFIEPTTLPASNDWITSMCGNFTERKKVVVGYTEIARKKKSLSNTFIRFQNSFKFINQFTWSKISKPAAGNAKNQAYFKELFFKNNGFIHQMNVPHGEEYGFINEISTRANTEIALNPDTFTTDKTKNTFAEWKLKLKEHNLLIANTSFANIIRHRLLNTSLLLFYIVFTIIICNLFQWELVLAIFVFRYLIAFFYTHKMLKKFNQKDLIWLFPILEFTYVITSTYYALTQFISNKKL